MDSKFYLSYSCAHLWLFSFYLPDSCAHLWFFICLSPVPTSGFLSVCLLCPPLAFYLSPVPTSFFLSA